MEDYKKLEDINRKMKTYKLMFMGLIIFLLIRMYLDYQNVQKFKIFKGKQISEYIAFDAIRRHNFLVGKNTNIRIRIDNVLYCENSNLNVMYERKLIPNVIPNDVITKLFITKDKNSNLLKTVINDTCFQFRVYPEGSYFGKLFE